MAGRNRTAAEQWVEQDPAGCRHDVEKLGLAEAARYNLKLAAEAVQRGDARWRSITLAGLVKALKTGTSTDLRGNPTYEFGPSAIPAKWTPATVSRKGGRFRFGWEDADMAKYTYRADTPMGLRVVTVTDAQINKRGKRSRSRELRDLYRSGAIVGTSEIARAYLAESKGSKSQNPAGIRAQVRSLPSGQIQLKIPIGRSENPHSVIAQLKKVFGKRVKAVEMTGGRHRNTSLSCNPHLKYAVIPRHGFFRDVAKVYSTHATQTAAIKAAKRRKVSLPGGRPGQSSAMVIQSEGGFSKGQKVYSDTIGHLYPVIW